MSTVRLRTSAPGHIDLQAENAVGAATVTVPHDDGATLISDLVLASNATGEGAALVGLNQGGTVQDAISYVTPQMFGAIADGVTDDRAAIQSAIDYVVSLGGGTVRFPTGTYKIVGVTGADTSLNGVIIPFTSFTVDNKITLEGEAGSILQGTSDNMFVVRVCQPGSELIGLQIEGGWDFGGGNTTTVGVGLVAADRTQTSTLVSQSFCKVIRCHITQCSTAIMVEPGPTVMGSQSGAFYPVIENCDLNINGRHVWLKASPHDATNRPTRGNIAFNRIERGNVGIDLSYATEFTLIGNNFQFFNTDWDQSSIPSVPYADSSAIRLGTLTDGNFLLGGHSEAASYDIYNSATRESALFIFGFSQSGVNFNSGVLPATLRNLHRVVKTTAANQQLAYVFGNNAGARLVYDYDADGSKTVALETNSVERMRWFNGVTTHRGSVGDVVMTATGELQVNNNIKFPSTPVVSADPNTLDDYEENTFTPAIAGETAAGAGTYSEQTGTYTKIGNRVMFSISLDWSAHTGTGNMRITGLPFASGSGPVPVTIYNSNIALTAGNILQGFINTSGSVVLLRQVPTGGGASVSVPIDTAGTIYVSGHYSV